MKTVVTLAMVSVLVLAGCGGGDDDAGGASSDDWCSLAQEIEDSGDQYDLAFEEGGATLGEALGEFTTLLDDAKAAAPSEISDAVDTSAEGIERLAELLEEVDYDLLALDESAFAELDEMGQEMEAATAEIEEYNERECGIPADGDAADESAQPDEATDGEATDGEATDGEATADEMADDEATDDEATDDEATDDEATDDEMADDEATDNVTFTGDPNSDWCVTNRELDEINEEFEDLFLAEPEVLEAKLTELIDMYEAAAPLAPPELAADVAVSLSTIQELEAALAEADYDFLTADLSVLDEDGAGVIANRNIEAYNEQVCGILSDDGDSGDDDDDGSGFDANAGTIRDQAVAELVKTGFTQAEAECVFDKIDFTDPELGNDPSAMIAVFDECGIDLARLAELGG